MPRKGSTDGLDRFAEAMAEHGGTIEEVSASIGLSWWAGRQHFRRMRRKLGWQAR